MFFKNTMHAACCAYRNYVGNNVGPATMPAGIRRHVADKVHIEILIKNYNKSEPSHFKN
jgi:hypothetical protein